MRSGPAENRRWPDVSYTTPWGTICRCISTAMNITLAEPVSASVRLAAVSELTSQIRECLQSKADTVAPSASIGVSGATVAKILPRAARPGYFARAQYDDMG